MLYSGDGLRRLLLIKLVMQITCGRECARMITGYHALIQHQARLLRYHHLVAQVAPLGLGGILWLQVGGHILDVDVE